MAAEHPFWFKYLWKDWLSSATTRSMNAAERGVYHEMLTRQFELGSLPSSPAEIAKISALTVEEVDAAWARVRPCFDLVNGRLVNAKMAEIHSNAIASHHKRRMAGLSGAAKRWSDSDTLDGWQSHSPNSNATPRAYDSDSKALDLDLPEESEDAEEENFFPNAEEILKQRAAAQKSDGRAVVSRGTVPAAAALSASQAIVAAAVEIAEVHGVEVTKRDRGTWAGVAKRIAGERSPEQIAAALFGMTRFPGQGWKFHQENPERSPWNPFDLEKFFAKAAAAGMTAVNGGGPAPSYDLERAAMIRNLEKYSNGNGRHD